MIKERFLQVAEWVLKHRAWVLGTFVISLVTVGFDYLETTQFYDSITATSKLRSAVERVYSVNPGFQNAIFVSSWRYAPELELFYKGGMATSSPAYDNFLEFLNSHSKSTEGLAPSFVLRLALKNAPYVDLPSNLNVTQTYLEGLISPELILGREFSPAVLGLCPKFEVGELISIPQCQLLVVGNRFELEQQIDERKRQIRTSFNFIIALLYIWFSSLQFN